MNEIDSQNETPPGTAPPPGPVARLAGLVLAVYGTADPDLRHAVRDSLQAGIPASTLNSYLSQDPERPIEDGGLT